MRNVWNKQNILNFPAFFSVNEFALYFFREIVSHHMAKSKQQGIMHDFFKTQAEF